MIFKFLVISWIAWTANSIIVDDDGLGNLQDFESIPSVENDDETSRRRHRRPRPCTPHRSLEEEKTFVNLYYTDIDYSIVPNMQGSASGCSPAFGSVSETNLNKPGEINSPAKPGLLQTLFGGFVDNRPQFQGIQSFQQEQLAPQGFGPLGGFASPPSQPKIDRINYKRTFKQFNREINRFFRPLYRLF